MFTVGDKVKWADEENGRQRERHGTVVEVVAIRRRPDRNRFPSLYSKSSGFGFARDHESYVVRAETTNYWPTTENLEKDE
jgi:hypothetical protein